MSTWETDKLTNPSRARQAASGRAGLALQPVDFGVSCPAMKLHVLPSGMISTNAFLLTDAGRGEALLIDAPGEVWPKVEPMLQAEGCQLTELWITHGHWDHTQGGAELVAATGVPVRAHVADQILIETPEVMEGYMGERLGLKGIPVDHWLEPGERLEALGLPVEVRHVPGHCPGNVLFWFETAGAAFVGDAIFAGSIGRTDLPGGSFEELEASIRREIYSLPDATVLYPGHGGPTDVAREKRSNPHVRP